MRRFFASVQRPKMVSPARWTTASKPETDSGDSGCAGSQAICPFFGCPPRTNRVTSNPRALSSGRRAAPIGPETPLTRMRSEFVRFQECSRSARAWQLRRPLRSQVHFFTENCSHASGKGSALPFTSSVQPIVAAVSPRQRHIITVKKSSSRDYARAFPPLLSREL